MSASKYHQMIDGFRFGMVLQLSLGPVFFFVLHTGIGSGIPVGMAAVLGVTIIDTLYLVLANLGVTRFAQHKTTRKWLTAGGVAIVAIFGLQILGRALTIGSAEAPTLISRMAERITAPQAFLTALLLTASSPLTILFWAGVFGAKAASLGGSPPALWRFTAGCVLSTTTFLSIAVIGGRMLGSLLPASSQPWLNATVGLLLLYFAAKLAFTQAPTKPGP